MKNRYLLPWIKQNSFNIFSQKLFIFGEISYCRKLFGHNYSDEGFCEVRVWQIKVDDKWVHTYDVESNFASAEEAMKNADKVLTEFYKYILIPQNKVEKLKVLI